MKVDFKHYQEMKAELKTLINHIGYIKLYQYWVNNKQDRISLSHSLWHKVYCNKTYTADNPNVIMTRQGRLLRYDPEFSMYPCNTNDDTLKTALIKAITEIFK